MAHRPHLFGCGWRRRRPGSNCAWIEPPDKWGMGKPGTAILVLALGLLATSLALGDGSVAERSQAVDDLQSAPRKNSNSRSRQRVVQARGIGQEGRSPNDNDQPAVDENSPKNNPENKLSVDSDELIDIHAPAADPAWPTWSAANDPAKQAIFAPAGYYDLVRPPDGISPDEEGQEYQRVVASEADLCYHEATCLPPINLLRPDGFAPVGVFGDHTLNTGGRLLLSHRFTNQAFDGMRDGTHSVSTASVLGAFPLAPTSMTSQEHFFLFEYGPTDDLTLQFIMPIVLFKINYVDRFGNRSFTDTTDLYDLQFNTMYVL